MASSSHRPRISPPAPPKGPGSAAAALQDAGSVEELLTASTLLVLPEEESLHWHLQSLHRKKRRAAASRAVVRLAKWLASESCNTPGGAREQCVHDTRFVKLVMCVAAEFEDDEGTSSMTEKTENELEVAFDAYRALGSLAPCSEDLRDAVLAIALRVSEESPLPPHRASVCVWASTRLLIDKTHPAAKKFAAANETPFRVLPDLFSKFGGGDNSETNYGGNPGNDSYDSYLDTSSTGTWESAGDILRDAAARKTLPEVSAVNSTETDDEPFTLETLTVKRIAKEVPFKTEQLVTRDGVRVDERRQTCWMAASGIGGLAYSGKVMRPVPFTPTMDKLRDFVFEKTGQRYDCCLLNLYPAKNVACKWHRDPDLGRLWARDSVIVSIGETRRFGFRKDLGNGKRGPEHWFRAKNGDAIWMFGDCNDAWEHCVYPGEHEGTDDAPRASVVFKRSLWVGKGGGTRGHAVKQGNGGTLFPGSGKGSRGRERRRCEGPRRRRGTRQGTRELMQRLVARVDDCQE